MFYRIGAALAALLLAVSPLWAQTPLPAAGQPVVNQAVSAVELTPSNSAIFTQTRGLHISDGLACTIKVMFSNDAVAVTLSNVQPGSVYPYSIKRLYSTGTTCAAVFGLY